MRRATASSPIICAPRLSSSPTACCRRTRAGAMCCAASCGATSPGECAFKPYDPDGFPYDLTEDALKARGLGVDAEGFAAAMERQRAEARKSWAGSGEAATEALWFELKEEFGATEVLGYGTGGPPA